MKIIILAGGSGTRLWPMSRRRDPKQLQPLIGKQTLLKSTYLRVRRGFKRKDIFLAVNSNQLAGVKKDLGKNCPSKNYFIEPVKKDTAAAIGLACALMSKTNPREIVAIVNSDHFIKNEQEYLRVLKSAGQVAAKYPDHLLLVGLKPRYPETGYGYIKLGKFLRRFGSDQVFTMAGFKEKPDLKTAQAMLKSGRYLWNPAYFVFRPAVMLELFKKHLPDQYEILMKIKNRPACLASEFKKIQPISIDYGIMEKAHKMLCLKASFDWTDVGHFKTVHEILAKGKNQDVVKGDYFSLTAGGNLIYGQPHKLIAAVGLQKMIVIDTKDALLICPQDQAQQVKKLVEALERKNLEKYL